MRSKDAITEEDVEEMIQGEGQGQYKVKLKFHDQGHEYIRSYCQGQGECKFHCQGQGKSHGQVKKAMIKAQG